MGGVQSHIIKVGKATLASDGPSWAPCASNVEQYPRPRLFSLACAEGGHVHSHWVVSQLSVVGDNNALGGKADSPSPRPRWIDSQADPSSWAGGMTLTHILSGEGTPHTGHWQPLSFVPPPPLPAFLYIEEFVQIHKTSEWNMIRYYHGLTFRHVLRTGQDLRLDVEARERRIECS